MFKLDIGKLVIAADDMHEAEESLGESRSECDETVLKLAREDFTGIAQYECLERFNKWMGSLDGLIGVTRALATVLDCATESAKGIMRKCDALPGVIGAACPQTPEGTGKLALDDYEAVGLAVQNIVDVDITALNTSCQSASWSCIGIADGAISDALASLQGSVTAVEDGVSALAFAHNAVASRILTFEAVITSALEAVDNGEQQDLPDILHTLSDAMSEVNAYALFGAVQTGAPHSFKMPDNVKIGYSNGYVRLKGYARTDGFGPRYKLSSLVKNKNLCPLAAYKGFRGISKVLGPAGYVLDAVNVVISPLTEYDRNPYLPSCLKSARAEAAMEAALFGTLLTMAAVPAAGIFVPASAGAVTVGAVGSAIGLTIEKCEDSVASSDIDSNGKTAYEEYLDWRMNSLYWNAINSSYLQDPEYYFFNNCFG